MNAKYIEIDGIDFCGKTTQVRFAYQFMRHDLGLKVWETQQPTRFLYPSQEIQEILKTNKDPFENAKKLTDLFIEERIALLNMIKMHLEDGISVVCSRGSLATYAYQTASGVDFDYIHRRHAELLKPNLVIILDLPVSVALQRKAAAARKEADVFEKDRKFLGQVRTNYTNLRSLLEKETITTINGDRKATAVSLDIQTLIKRLFDINHNV